MNGAPVARPGLDDVLADLQVETDELRAAVASLDEDGWGTATPAKGWTVADQVAHLLWTDEAATLAAVAAVDLDDPARKQPWDDLVLTALGDPDGFVDASAHEIAALGPAALLERWDAARAALVEALRAVPDGARMPWFGPPMSPTSMATARFMETWAHALDVHDALGLAPEPSDRIRHVAHLGVRTRGFAFAQHGEPEPDVEPRVVLTAPSGDVWTYGPRDAEQPEETVTGTALDFCRLVTQRVHRDDTDLVAVGPGADRWLDVAQCFAGNPGAGREARGR